MAGVADMFYGTVVNPQEYEYRPPVGEIWQVVRFEKDINAPAGDPDIYVRYAGGKSLLASADADLFLGPLWLNNTLWMYMANSSASTINSYCLYVMRYQVADVPMRVLAIDLPADGAYEIRPPAGTEWMGKGLWGTSGVRAYLKNASVEADYSAIPNRMDSEPPGFKHGGGASLYLSNSAWVRVWYTSTSLVIFTYAELAAGTLEQKTGFLTMGSGGAMLEVRPPAGEVWTVGAWSSSNLSRLEPWDGSNIRSDLARGARLRTEAPAGNTKWLRINSTSAGVSGYIGWKHPL